LIDWLIDWLVFSAMLMSMWHLLINHRFLVNKISLTTPLSIELPRSSQEIYTCWRYRLFLFPRFVYWTLELFRQCGIFFSFFFSCDAKFCQMFETFIDWRNQKQINKFIIIWNKILSFNNGLYDNDFFFHLSKLLPDLTMY
jgi:hypothetical protein